jgi:hypothetical protein
MDHDDYGFCNDLDRNAVKVLDREGLVAFEREVQARFDTACKKREDRNYERDRWGAVLRSIYIQQCSMEKYLDLTARTRLTQAACEAVALQQW